MADCPYCGSETPLLDIFPADVVRDLYERRVIEGDSNGK